MKTTWIILLLCATAATAATVPFPILKIKRPAPVLSPKHAAEPKATPMKRQTLAAGGGGGAELPKRLPMKAYCVASIPRGHMNFTAEALQPPNQSVLFELSSSLTDGSWVTLAWFGPYPVAQQVFAMVPLGVDFANIRATAGVAPSGAMSRVAVAAPGAIGINPDVPGVQAWRGVR